MTLAGVIQIVVFALLTWTLTKPLGLYMCRVFEGENQPMPRLFGPIERFGYRAMGVDSRREQTWVEYALALLFFRAFGVLVT
jgi:K+-transporting ATPase ATPase A chain